MGGFPKKPRNFLTRPPNTYKGWGTAKGEKVRRIGNTGWISYVVIRFGIAMCLVALAVPAKAMRRVAILAKTPIVRPVDKRGIYAVKYYGKYTGLIEHASDEFDVPAPLIAAVIRAESGFNQYAISSEGARGLMQIMPSTWDDLGGTGSIFNPGQNIKLGTKYLKGLLDEFDGDLILAVAAYNAGPGAVKKHRKVPPYRETRRYVPRVLTYYIEYKLIANNLG